MLDVHPPHAPTHSWKDFFTHIATIVVGLLIAVGLEQTVETIHHHHQRDQLETDLREESVKNIQIIDHDLKFARFAPWFDQTAAAASRPGDGIIHVTLTPIPCIPGFSFDGSIRMSMPYESVWITAQENGIAPLIPAEQARVYSRRSSLFDLAKRFYDGLYDNCPRLNAMQRRLAQRSNDGRTYDWTMTRVQAEELATLASQETATIKAFSLRLRYLRAFEQDLIDGGHRINGASLDQPLTEFFDPEDLPPPH